jgi:hypothetical protein
LVVGWDFRRPYFYLWSRRCRFGRAQLPYKSAVEKLCDRPVLTVYSARSTQFVVAQGARRDDLSVVKIPNPANVGLSVWREGPAREQSCLDFDSGQRVGGRLRRFSASRKRGGPKWEPWGPVRGLPNGEPGVCQFRAFQPLCPGLRCVRASGALRTAAAGLCPACPAARL